VFCRAVSALEFSPAGCSCPWHYCFLPENRLCNSPAFPQAHTHAHPCIHTPFYRKATLAAMFLISVPAPSQWIGAVPGDFLSLVFGIWVFRHSDSTVGNFLLRQGIMILMKWAERGKNSCTLHQIILLFLGEKWNTGNFVSLILTSVHMHNHVWFCVCVCVCVCERERERERLRDTETQKRQGDRA
jgi:hypothetical protein